MDESALERYRRFFESLRPETRDGLSDVMTENVQFVDPFNDVTGIDRVRAIFADMFETLDAPRFVVSDAALVPGNASRGLLRWEMHAVRNGKPLRITGMSELTFDGDGRVCLHIDHWDAARQVYERLPLLGPLLRRIRARLSA